MLIKKEFIMQYLLSDSINYQCGFKKTVKNTTELIQLLHEMEDGVAIKDLNNNHHSILSDSRETSLPVLLIDENIIPHRVYIYSENEMMTKTNLEIILDYMKNNVMTTHTVSDLETVAAMAYQDLQEKNDVYNSIASFLDSLSLTSRRSKKELPKLMALKRYMLSKENPQMEDGIDYRIKLERKKTIGLDVSGSEDLFAVLKTIESLQFSNDIAKHFLVEQEEILHTPKLNIASNQAVFSYCPNQLYKTERFYMIELFLKQIQYQNESMIDLNEASKLAFDSFKQEEKINGYTVFMNLDDFFSSIELKTENKKENRLKINALINY